MKAHWLEQLGEFKFICSGGSLRRTPLGEVLVHDGHRHLGCGLVQEYTGYQEAPGVRIETLLHKVERRSRWMPRRFGAITWRCFPFLGWSWGEVGTFVTRPLFFSFSPPGHSFLILPIMIAFSPRLVEAHFYNSC